MGRLRFGPLACLVVAVSLFLFFPACGKGKAAPASPFPAKIVLTPVTSFSMQAGTTLQLSAVAVNGAGTGVAATFTYLSSNTSILDISPGGGACAGTWNAPSYNVCTPAAMGAVQVTASALGATSPPTYFFIHAPIDNIQISYVAPVNSPPPACPNQTALPAACNLKFNTNVCLPNQPCACLSTNQTETLQATAYSQGVDITASVGPFAWTEASPSVSTITPIVTVNSYNVPTNQATVTPNTPGQTQVIASASGAFSQPYVVSTCNIQCIDLQVGVNGLQQSGTTNFVVNKGTSEVITATAVNVQGCIVPKPPLTWVSSAPAVVLPGTTASGCSAGSTCTATTPQPGAAAITASCTPPTCNIGYPLNLSGLPAPYIPQPVYPITAISGIVTGTPANTNVLATSHDCYSTALCGVGLYNVATASTVSGGSIELPTAPNSLIINPAGNKAYMGSQFGAVAINPANIGVANPYTFLPAAGTPLDLVTGSAIAVSSNGNSAVFADNVSTPNQVYVVNTAGTTPTSTALNINSAVAATFSPDGLKAYILGNGGTSLYTYSTLQALLPPIALPTPATLMVFNSTGSFALFSGGATAGNLAAYNTCDNSAITLPAGTVPGPPLFLKMVPGGNVPLGSVFGNVFIPLLQPAGLDFFFGLDTTGIDIIATNTSLLPLPLPTGPITLNTLCPRPVVLAQNAASPYATFNPVHINIGAGTFHPINFFISPDSTHAYIVTTDHGVLVYDFDTAAVTGILLVNNATPVAADITQDGTLLYVAGSDGLLHQLNTALAADENQISFTPLPDSTSAFCFTGNNCALNMVVVKP